MSQHVPTEPVYLPGVNKRYPATKKLGIRSHAILNVLNDEPDKTLVSDGPSLNIKLAAILNNAFDLGVTPHDVGNGLPTLLRLGLIQMDEDSISLTSAGVRAASDMVKYGSNKFVVFYHVHRLGQIKATDDKSLYDILSETTGLRHDHVTRGLKQLVRDDLVRVTKKRSNGNTYNSAIINIGASTTPTRKTTKKATSKVTETTTETNDEPRYAPSQAFMLASEQAETNGKVDLSDTHNQLIGMFDRAVAQAAEKNTSADYSKILYSILATIKKVNDGKMTTMNALSHIETLIRTAMKEKNDVGTQQAVST